VPRGTVPCLPRNRNFFWENLYLLGKYLLLSSSSSSPDITSPYAIFASSFFSSSFHLVQNLVSPPSPLHSWRRPLSMSQKEPSVDRSPLAENGCYVCLPLARPHLRIFALSGGKRILMQELQSAKGIHNTLIKRLILIT